MKLKNYLSTYFTYPLFNLLQGVGVVCWDNLKNLSTSQECISDTA